VETDVRRLLQAVVTITDLDLDEVLRSLLEAATDLVGARYGALGVISSDGRGLSRFVHTGIDEDLVDQMGHLPRGRGVLGRLIVDPRPLRIDDLGCHPSAVGFPAGHPPMRSFLGVPMSVRGQVFGNLYLTEKRRPDGGPAAFTDDDEEVAVALAAVAGVAVSNARLHVEAQRLAVFEDRDRIAHDLHDHVIQRLFAAGLSLQALTSRLDGPSDDETRTRLAAVVAQLDETVRDVRTTIFELHTSDSAGGGLRRRLLTVVGETAGGSTSSVRTSGPVDTVVTGTLAADVLAVTREAVSNAVRHGGAGALVVTVEVRDDAVQVQVDDDGTGFDAGTARSGLAGLELRAERRGGSLLVGSHPEGGTRLRWSAPLGS